MWCFSTHRLQRGAMPCVTVDKNIYNAHVQLLLFASAGGIGDDHGAFFAAVSAGSKRSMPTNARSSRYLSYLPVL